MNDVNRIVQGAAELWINGSNIGLLHEGVTISITPTYFDIEVEQYTGPVDTILVSEMMTISTTMSEMDLSRMKVAFNADGSAYLGGTFLGLGNTGGHVTHTLIVVANAPTSSGYAYMNYHVFKAISFEAIDILHQSTVLNPTFCGSFLVKERLKVRASW